MNTGVIASRYAKALLLITQESGRGEFVFEQARALLKTPLSIPAELEPDLSRLVVLLKRNGRGDYLRLILTDYLHLYCQTTGAKLVRLVTAVPAPELPAKIRHIIGGKVYMDTEVDPSLEGGFVLTMDDRMLDASVKGQIERIRRQFIERNLRIV